MMLKTAMQQLLSDVYAMYVRAHGFHWNVTGPDFPEYHALFERIYGEVYDSIDSIAEHIRAIDEFPIGSLVGFAANTMIKTTGVPGALDMVRELDEANNIVLVDLGVAFGAAMSANEQGLANFLSERIDQHRKHRWMLRATLA